jgi:hypothetical protein
MQHLEVSSAVRHVYMTLCGKGLSKYFAGENNLQYPFGHGWIIDEISILTYCTTLIYYQLVV